MPLLHLASLFESPSERKLREESEACERREREEESNRARQTNLLLRELVRLSRDQLLLLERISREIHEPRRLTSVRLMFKKHEPYPIFDTSKLPPDWAEHMFDLQYGKIQYQQHPSHPQGASPAMPTPGPLSLTLNQTATATLQYLDQSGQPMPSTFVPPPVTFSIDDSTIVSSTPESDSQTDDLVAVADGVANLTASVTSAEGLALSDTQPITVTSPAAILSAVRLQFTAN